MYLHQSKPPFSAKIKTPARGAFILAGPAGFEPTDDGVKVRCLTAWRRPIIKNSAAQENLCSGFEAKK